MAALTIREIDGETLRLLKERAARHNRTPEDEARRILRSALSAQQAAEEPLGDRLVELSRPGVDLPELRDQTPHEPVTL